MPQPPHATSIDIRIATVAEIRPLRQAVLIDGTERVSADFDGDDRPTTIHVAAFADDQCVGCVSLMREPWCDKPAWQLRGMAVDPAYRGIGLGSRLLKHCHTQAGGMPMWCNARQDAAGFYHRFGWKTIGEPFDIDGVGPHLRMLRDRRIDATP